MEQVEEQEERCKNCDAIMVGPYCYACGQPVAKRIMWSTFTHRFYDRYLDLDHGIPHTIWSLLTKPGETLRNYIEGKRASYTDPVKLMLITVSIVTLVMVQGGIMTEYMEYGRGVSDGFNGQTAEASEISKQSQNELGQWMLDYMQVWLLFAVPFSALFNWLFFKKQKYNLAETFLMSCYLNAMQNIISLPFLLVILVLPPSALWNLYMFSGVASFGFSTYALMSFYRAQTVSGFLKALSSVVLSLVTFLIVFMVVIGIVMVVLIMTGHFKLPKKNKAKTKTEAAAPKDSTGIKHKSQKQAMLLAPGSYRYTCSARPVVSLLQS